jgi:hypothetical protein
MRAIGVLETYGRKALSGADAVIPRLSSLHVQSSGRGLRVMLLPPPA